MRLLFGTRPNAHVDVEQLSAYLDGQIREVDRRRVEAHLQGCAACQREFAALSQTVELLHALPRVALPRAFTLSEAQVGIRQKGAGPVWLGGLARGMAAVGGFAVVVLVGAYLLRNTFWQAPQLVAVAPVVAPAAAKAVSKAEPADALRPQAAAPAAAPPAEAPRAAPAPTKALVAAPRQAESTKAPGPTKAPEPTVAKASEKPVERASEPTKAPALAEGKTVPAAPPAAAAKAAPAATAQPMAAAGAGDAAGKIAPAFAASAAPDALPAGLALAYADANGLWAFEGENVRLLVRAGGVSAQAISPDRAAVAYRQQRTGGAEVSVAPWGGAASPAKPLLTESELNTGLPATIRQRRILAVDWLQRDLLVSTEAISARTDATPTLELWRIDAVLGTRRLLTSIDVRSRPAVSPNAAQIAFFRGDPERAADGSLRLIGSDGTGDRALLRFPASPEQRTYADQIRWLPDGSAFWVAIPDAELGRPNGLTLYRVPVKGEIPSGKHIAANTAHWSPDGARLAFVRLVDGDATGPAEIYLAAADGSNAQLYATMSSGGFSGWSPDGAAFLFEDKSRLLLGRPEQKAQLLAGGAAKARWVAADQILYLAEGGRGWVLQGLDGKTRPLTAVPPNAEIGSAVP